MSLDYNSTRTLALTLGRRAISDIRRDGLRQLRNYVDMCTLLVRDPLPKAFFGYLQSELADADTPYFGLVRRMISQVAEDTLCTVGVNLGLGSMLYGAGLLAERSDGCRVLPWMTISSGDDTGLAQAVEKGEWQGSFLWALHLKGPVNSAVTALIARHPHSTFQLLIEPEYLQKASAEALRRLPIVMVLLWLRSTVLTQAVRDAARHLKSAAALYGLAVTLDDASAGEILSPVWLEEAAACAPVCVCLHGPGMSGSASAMLEREIRSCRVRGDAGMLLVDWQGDVRGIDSRMPPHTAVTVRGSLASDCPLRV